MYKHIFKNTPIILHSVRFKMKQLKINIYHMFKPLLMSESLSHKIQPVLFSWQMCLTKRCLKLWLNSKYTGKHPEETLHMVFGECNKFFRKINLFYHQSPIPDCNKCIFPLVSIVPLVMCCHVPELSQMFFFNVDMIYDWKRQLTIFCNQWIKTPITFGRIQSS